MTVGELCHHTATWRTLDETLHNQEWLIDLLYSTGIFTDGCGDGSDSYRTTTELVDDGKQDLIVDFIETILVDIQGSQGNLGNLCVNLAIAFHLGEVSYTAQQGVGNTGRTTTATCNL